MLIELTEDEIRTIAAERTNWNTRAKWLIGFVAAVFLPFTVAAVFSNSLYVIIPVAIAGVVLGWRILSKYESFLKAQGDALVNELRSRGA